MTSSRQKIELPIDEQLGLDTLGVEYRVDSSVISLITKNVLKAGKLVVNEIRKEISDGLPVREVPLARLDDHDAGQWSELVFIIKVALETKEADEAWDRILGKIDELIESKMVDKSTKVALLETINVWLRWR